MEAKEGEEGPTVKISLSTLEVFRVLCGVNLQNPKNKEK